MNRKIFLGVVAVLMASMAVSMVPMTAAYGYSDCDVHCAGVAQVCLSSVTGAYGTMDFYYSDWSSVYPHTAAREYSWLRIAENTAEHYYYAEIGVWTDNDLINYLGEGIWIYVRVQTDLDSYYDDIYEVYGFPQNLDFAIGKDGNTWRFYVDDGDGYENIDSYTPSRSFTGTTVETTLQCRTHYSNEPQTLAEWSDVHYQISGWSWYNVIHNWDAVYCTGDCEVGYFEVDIVYLLNNHWYFESYVH